MRSARTILLIKAHQPDFYTSYDVTVRNVAGHDQHVDVNICDLYRSTFQSSNPIGQNIIHNYMRICAVALTTP